MGRKHRHKRKEDRNTEDNEEDLGSTRTSGENKAIPNDESDIEIDVLSNQSASSKEDSKEFAKAVLNPEKSNFSYTNCITFGFADVEVDDRTIEFLKEGVKETISKDLVELSQKSLNMDEKVSDLETNIPPSQSDKKIDKNDGETGSKGPISMEKALKTLEKKYHAVSEKCAPSKKQTLSQYVTKTEEKPHLRKQQETRNRLKKKLLQRRQEENMADAGKDHDKAQERKDLQERTQQKLSRPNQLQQIPKTRLKIKKQEQPPSNPGKNNAENPVSKPNIPDFEWQGQRLEWIVEHDSSENWGSNSDDNTFESEEDEDMTVSQVEQFVLCKMKCQPEDETKRQHAQEFQLTAQEYRTKRNLCHIDKLSELDAKFERLKETLLKSLEEKKTIYSSVFKTLFNLEASVMEALLKKPPNRRQQPQSEQQRLARDSATIHEIFEMFQRQFPTLSALNIKQGRVEMLLGISKKSFKEKVFPKLLLLSRDLRVSMYHELLDKARHAIASVEVELAVIKHEIKDNWNQTREAKQDIDALMASICMKNNDEIKSCEEAAEEWDAHGQNTEEQRHLQSSHNKDSGPNDERHIESDNGEIHDQNDGKNNDEIKPCEEAAEEWDAQGKNNASRIHDNKDSGPNDERHIESDNGGTHNQNDVKNNDEIKSCEEAVKEGDAQSKKNTEEQRHLQSSHNKDSGLNDERHIKSENGGTHDQNDGKNNGEVKPCEEADKEWDAQGQNNASRIHDNKDSGPNDERHIESEIHNQNDGKNNDEIKPCEEAAEEGDAQGQNNASRIHDNKDSDMNNERHIESDNGDTHNKNDVKNNDEIKSCEEAVKEWDAQGQNNASRIHDNKDSGLNGKRHIESDNGGTHNQNDVRANETTQSCEEATKEWDAQGQNTEEQRHLQSKHNNDDSGLNDERHIESDNGGTHNQKDYIKNSKTVIDVEKSGQIGQSYRGITEKKEQNIAKLDVFCKTEITEQVAQAATEENSAESAKKLNEDFQTDFGHRGFKPQQRFEKSCRQSPGARDESLRIQARWYRVLKTFVDQEEAALILLTIFEIRSELVIHPGEFLQNAQTLIKLCLQDLGIDHYFVFLHGDENEMLKPTETGGYHDDRFPHERKFTFETLKVVLQAKAAERFYIAEQSADSRSEDKQEDSGSKRCQNEEKKRQRQHKPDVNSTGLQDLHEEERLGFYDEEARASSERQDRQRDGLLNKLKSLLTAIVLFKSKNDPEDTKGQETLFQMILDCGIEIATYTGNLSCDVWDVEKLSSLAQGLARERCNLDERHLEMEQNKRKRTGRVKEEQCSLKIDSANHGRSYAEVLKGKGVLTPPPPPKQEKANIRKDPLLNVLKGTGNQTGQINMVPLCKQVNGKLQKEEKCQRSSKSNDSAALPEVQGKQELEKVTDDKNDGGRTSIGWVNPGVPQSIDEDRETEKHPQNGSATEKNSNHKDNVHQQKDKDQPRLSIAERLRIQLMLRNQQEDQARKMDRLNQACRSDDHRKR
ncbi:hypothetical protein PoB_003223500 [Plakobranchus ocellatus]|uniref:Uncharacterized protein n=1 Tax=Plakobranchus ocellatus TaxID=259542 RepID=A0AAV4AG60_9GAST|nr:hypothetical protein PoB_003223500 [Plakobranchus ocellatus]